VSVNAFGGEAFDVLGDKALGGDSLGTDALDEQRVGKGILLIWSAPQTRLVFDDSEFWLQARLVSRVVSQVPIGQSTVHAASV
jgi:hypothetical protein